MSPNTALPASNQPSAIVLYHNHCPSLDGFASAFAAWLALGNSARYVPADYGDQAPDATGADVFILDLSFPPAQMERLGSQARSLTLLDHHLTAQRSLSSFKPLCCGKIHFDLNRCGAVLAWEHFHPTRPLPRLFACIQARDLWRWDQPRAPELLAWLDTQPKNFERWMEILAMTDAELDERADLGAALLAQRAQFCASIAAEPIAVVVAGASGLMVNASPEFRSDVGSLLATRSGSFGLLWRVASDGMVHCSLRSVAPFDVERIATLFGGGGHPTAASFDLHFDKLPELVRGRIDP
jgi:oligoribonuclease NrnB/cAMP/cGMP phosphodiesterase (DHH superfamily)